MWRYEAWQDSSTGLSAWQSAGCGVGQVLPDAHADLILRRGHWLIAGYDTRVHTIDRGSGETSYGVRLPPGALPWILQRAAADAVDRRIGVSEVDPELARRLHQMGRHKVPIDKMLAQVACEVAERLAHRHEMMDLCQVLTGWSASGMTVASMAEELGWSTRRLHRFSIAAFGIPPAVMREILRFRSAMGLLRAGVGPAVAAAAAGYADQSHLSRATRRFANSTPGCIHRSQHAGNDAASS